MQQKLPASGGFALIPLTKGSAPGHCWVHSHQAPAYFFKSLLFLPKPIHRVSGAE